jgi:class 3 adenylate cyclase/tetratricopeptide (TPR) repeat protein
MGADRPAAAALLAPYAPRLALEWLRDDPRRRRRAVDATLVMADVSGFTALSERLAKLGKVGAEELTEIIGATFSELLSRAYRLGGSLLKFGGDALLLLFDGEDHPRRGCHAAVSMRSALRTAGAISTSAGDFRLRMSVGVHSGTVHVFLVGESHRELVVCGPGVSEALRMETAARAGQILVSPATAAIVGERCLGPRSGGGRVLARAPEAEPGEIPPVPRGIEPGVLVSSMLRGALVEGADEAEHRQVTITFLRFRGVDDRLRAGRAATVEAQIARLVAAVQEAADAHGICFLGSDVAGDGGKILLTAGAPRTAPDDDDRMLRAVRDVFDRYRGLSLGAGTDRGYVFAGSVGPAYRRTYTVMGDAVNTAARIMAQAEPGRFLASLRVLDRAATLFETDELEPFAVKGKKELHRAAAVGRPIGVRTPDGTTLPLVGRADAMASLMAAGEAAAAGRGRLIAVAGEAGIGKTRLLAEVASTTEVGTVIWAAGGPHAELTPYHVVGQIMRTIVGGRVTPSRLRRFVREIDPELEGVLPLLGVALGFDIPATAQTAQLDPAFRPRATERALIAFLRAALDTDAVLLIDELDRADPASVGVLRALAPGIGEQPWLVVAAARGVVHPLDAVADETIELGPLTAEDSARLAVEAAGGALLPDEGRRFADRAAGHPLFLIELAGARAGAGDSLPASLEAMIAARIDDLSGRDRALLRRLAVIGRELDPELAAALVGDTRDARRAVERLAGFLERDGDKLRFRQALYQEVAYEGLPYRSRRSIHQQVGLLLEEGASTDDDAGVLSHHFERSGDTSRTWRYAWTAARAAQHAAAHVEAVILYRRAIEAGLRLEMDEATIAAAHHELADSLNWSGRIAEAAEVYRSARRRTADAATTALLYQREGAMRARLGQWTRALGLYARGLRVLDGAGIVAGRWRLSAAYGAVRREQRRLDDALRWGRDAVRDAEGDGDRLGLAHAYNVMFMVFDDLRDPQARRFAELALAIFEQEGKPTFAADVLNNLAVLSKDWGRWDDALALYERSRRAFEAVGYVLGAAVVAQNIGAILSDQGRYPEAEGALADALSTFRAAGLGPFIRVVERNLGQVAARAGRGEEADRLFAGLFHTASATDLDAVRAFAAESLVLQGRGTEATEMAAPLLRSGEEQRRAFVLRVLAYAAMQRGDMTEAERLGADSLREAQARGDVYDEALALEFFGRIGGHAERLEQALVIFGTLGVVATPSVPLREVAPAPGTAVS